MIVLTDDEKEALALLARNHRVFVILIPKDVHDEDIKAIVSDVDSRLDELVERRGRYDA